MLAGLCLNSSFSILLFLLIFFLIFSLQERRLETTALAARLQCDSVPPSECGHSTAFDAGQSAKSNLQTVCRKHHSPSRLLWAPVHTHPKVQLSGRRCLQLASIWAPTGQEELARIRWAWAEAKMVIFHVGQGPFHWALRATWRPLSAPSLRPPSSWAPSSLTPFGASPSRRG